MNAARIARNVVAALFRERRQPEAEPKCLDDIIKLIRADMYGRRSTDLDSQEVRRMIEANRKAKGLPNG